MSEVKLLEGVVFKVNGKIDWDNCEVEGLVVAYSKINQEYDQMEADNEQAMKDVINSIYGSDEDSIMNASKRLQETAFKEGFDAGFNENEEFIKTPHGKVTETKVDKFYTRISDGARIEKLRIKVELY